MNMITFLPFVSIASQNQTVMNGELIELTSTITLGRFSDSIHAGRHYCQAQVEGVSSLLSPSNALTFTTNDSVLNFNPYRDSNLTETEDFTQTTRGIAGNIDFSTVLVQPATVAPTSTSQSGSYSTSPLQLLSHPLCSLHLSLVLSNPILLTASIRSTLSQFVGVCVSW